MFYNEGDVGCNEVELCSNSEVGCNKCSTMREMWAISRIVPQ